jgi:hypothetical protein
MKAYDHAICTHAHMHTHTHHTRARTHTIWCTCLYLMTIIVSHMLGSIGGKSTHGVIYVVYMYVLLVSNLPVRRSRYYCKYAKSALRNI